MYLSERRLAFRAQAIGVVDEAAGGASRALERFAFK
jgi:hypothetical protein